MASSKVPAKGDELVGPAQGSMNHRGRWCPNLWKWWRNFIISGENSAPGGTFVRGFQKIPLSQCIYFSSQNSPPLAGQSWAVTLTLLPLHCISHNPWPSVSGALPCHPGLVPPPGGHRAPALPESCFNSINPCQAALLGEWDAAKGFKQQLRVLCCVVVMDLGQC